MVNFNARQFDLRFFSFQMTIEISTILTENRPSSLLTNRNTCRKMLVGTSFDASGSQVPNAHRIMYVRHTNLDLSTKTRLTLKKRRFERTSL